MKMWLDYHYRVLVDRPLDDRDVASSVLGYRLDAPASLFLLCLLLIPDCSENGAVPIVF